MVFWRYFTHFYSFHFLKCFNTFTNLSIETCDTTTNSRSSISKLSTGKALTPDTIRLVYFSVLAFNELENGIRIKIRLCSEKKDFNLKTLFNLARCCLHDFNSSTLEAETERAPWIWGHPGLHIKFYVTGLHSENLLQIKQEKKKERQEPWSIIHLHLSGYSFASLNVPCFLLVYLLSTAFKKHEIVLLNDHLHPPTPALSLSLFFQDKFSLCNIPDYSGTLFVDQASLQLREIHLPPENWDKGMHHHAGFHSLL